MTRLAIRIFVQMPKRHIFNKNSTLVVKRLKYLFWSHTVLSISKLRDVAKAVKSLEIPAFPKLIFQDWFCVISFLDAQDSENPVISTVTGFFAAL